MQHRHNLNPVSEELIDNSIALHNHLTHQIMVYLWHLAAHARVGFQNLDRLIEALYKRGGIDR